MPVAARRLRLSPEEMLRDARDPRRARGGDRDAAPSLRAAFLLRDVEGLTTAEAAEALGVTEANLKVRLHRARLLLRERLSAFVAARGRPRESAHDLRGARRPPVGLHRRRARARGLAPRSRSTSRAATAATSCSTRRSARSSSPARRGRRPSPRTAARAAREARGRLQGARRLLSGSAAPRGQARRRRTASPSRPTPRLTSVAGSGTDWLVTSITNPVPPPWSSRRIWR